MVYISVQYLVLWLSVWLHFFRRSLLLLLFVVCLFGTAFDLWYRFTARMRWKLIYSIDPNGPQTVSPPPSPSELRWTDHTATAGTVRRSDDPSSCSTDGDGAHDEHRTELGGSWDPPDRTLLRRAYCFQPGLWLVFEPKLEPCINSIDIKIYTVKSWVLYK